MNMMSNNCVLLPAAGRRMQLFALIFSEPGVRGLADPCREEGAVRRSCRGRHDGSFGIGVRSVHFREGSIQSEDREQAWILCMLEGGCR